MEHLIERWNVEQIQGLNGDAAQAQVGAEGEGGSPCLLLRLAVTSGRAGEVLQHTLMLYIDLAAAASRSAA